MAPCVLVGGPQQITLPAPKLVETNQRMDAAITEERKMSLDACIVRTMKARTTLQHAVTSLLRNRWPCFFCSAVTTMALLTLCVLLPATRRGDHQADPVLSSRAATDQAAHRGLDWPAVPAARGPHEPSVAVHVRVCVPQQLRCEVFTIRCVLLLCVCSYVAGDGEE